MKKIDKSAHIGDEGIALVHQRVHEMGFVWHERKTDAGIDGEIELRNPVTGEVANRVLFVQSKASGRRFPGENDSTFHFLCSDADIDYWMQAPVPVLLVFSHPATGEAWWMNVQDWFSDPTHRASRRIDVDKSTQRFDRSAAHRLLNLADPHGDAHVPVAEDRPETLTSNLLRVTTPSVIYRAAVGTSEPHEVIIRQRELSTPELPVAEDFIIRGGRVHTLRPPHQTALGLVIKEEPEPMDAGEWAASDDDRRQRWFVQLLNHALRVDVSADCTWHEGRKIVFWTATPDLSARSIRSASGRTRQVFTPKRKKSAPDQISYCLHAALEWQFLDIEGRWYCALVPTYHYTRDGYRESLFLSEYLSGIKRLDRNPAVYHQVRMWAHYLQGGGEDTLDLRGTTLTYGRLETLDAEKGIDDQAWLVDPRKPADEIDLMSDAGAADLADADEELALFEVPR